MQGFPDLPDRASHPPLLVPRYSKRAAVGVLVAGVCVVLVTTYEAFVFASTIAQAIAMKSWAERPATIERVELHRHMSHSKHRSGPTYTVSAEYTYDVDGQHYRGNRVSLYERADNVDSFHQDAYTALERARQSHTPFHCYVDPQAPRSSILFRELRPAMTTFALLFFPIFGGLSLLFLYGVWDWARRRRYPERYL